MNDVIHSAVLGLIQGLGEFLPISSSGHLVLLPWLFRWEYQGMSYDIMLHLGTLVAVCAYFWKDWVKIIKDGIISPASEDGKVLWMLAAATVPGALAGLVLEHKVETIFHNPVYVAVNLILFAIILWLADRKGETNTGEKVTFGAAMLIGCAQAFSIMPGVSRSGSTIIAALLLGMKREYAVRFSFLLSVPIICGAAVLGLRHLSISQLEDPLFVTGFLTSVVFGWFAIKFLMGYVKKYSLSLFVWYRIALGALIITMVCAGR